MNLKIMFYCSGYQTFLIAEQPKEFQNILIRVLMLKDYYLIGWSVTWVLDFCLFVCLFLIQGLAM
jgi:hypothetical protein